MDHVQDRWRAPLVTCMAADLVHDRYDVVQTYSWCVLARHTSLTLAFLFRPLLDHIWTCIVTLYCPADTHNPRSNRSSVWNILPHYLHRSEMIWWQFASGLIIWLFNCTYTWRHCWEYLLQWHPVKLLVDWPHVHYKLNVSCHRTWFKCEVECILLQLVCMIFQDRHTR